MAAGDVVRSSTVSPEFFDVLGVTPALGRRLGAADSTPDAPPVAVIADGSGGASAVRVRDRGRQVRATAGRITIIGVAPPRFSGLESRRAHRLVDSAAAGGRAREPRQSRVVGRRTAARRV